MYIFFMEHQSLPIFDGATECLYSYGAAECLYFHGAAECLYSYEAASVFIF